MKKLQELEPQAAGPVWGLVLGVFMAEAGIGLWFYGETLEGSGQIDEFLAVAAAIVGVVLAFYACRKIFHQRKG